MYFLLACLSVSSLEARLSSLETRHSSREKRDETGNLLLSGSHSGSAYLGKVIHCIKLKPQTCTFSPAVLMVNSLNLIFG